MKKRPRIYYSDTHFSIDLNQEQKPAGLCLEELLWPVLAQVCMCRNGV